jgi:hypothetical protein
MQRPSRAVSDGSRAIFPPAYTMMDEWVLKERKNFPADRDAAKRFPN